MISRLPKLAIYDCVLGYEAKQHGEPGEWGLYQKNWRVDRISQQEKLERSFKISESL